MKPANIFLLGSFVANVLLGVGVVKNNYTAGVGTDRESKQSASPVARDEPVQKEASTSTPQDRLQKSWERLKTDDLIELKRRLKAAGFPGNVVSEILRDLIFEHFDSRFKALDAQGVRPYWKPRGVSDPQRQKAFQDLRTEQVAMLRSVLGGLGRRMDDGEAEFRRRWEFGDLPAEKADAIVKINDDYNEISRQFWEAGQDPRRQPSAADVKKSLQIEREKRSDLEKLLTKEELFEYDIRNSPIAEQLRQGGRYFQPSETEFRALFAQYQKTAEQRVEAMLSSSGPLDVAELQEKIFELSPEAAKAVLSPDRYADFLQSRDPASEKLNRITQRLDLPLSTATSVVSARQDATARAEAIRFNSNLSSEQKQAQLTALAAETTTKINRVLGDRGYSAYKRYDGKWLDSLTSFKR